MTNEEIRVLLDVEAAATAGEVVVKPRFNCLTGETVYKIGPVDNDGLTQGTLENAALFAAARNAIRPLAEEVLRLREALRFYARHEHWMPIHESPGCPEKLLIANGSNAVLGHGWEEAEAVLESTV